MTARQRIFVTGATGVIGRRVVPRLLAAGHAVTAVGRTPDKRDALARLGAAPSDASLFDVGALREALAGHDAAVNLATHIPRSMNAMMFRRAWRENDRVRRDGSAALAEAAHLAGVGRLVQESFAPVYEDGGARWIDETWPVRPTAYNRTVLDAERSAARFTERGGVGVVLRFALFYGPDSGFLRDMTRVIRLGWLPIPGDAAAYVSSVSHDDAAAAVLTALGAPAGTYNVADDEPLTRAAWGAAFAASLGVAAPRPLPGWLARLGGSTTELLGRSQRISNAKLRALGWKPARATFRP